VSDLIDRVFAAVPPSEWAGEELDFLPALRLDVEPMGPLEARPDGPALPARKDNVCADCSTPISKAATRCRHCAKIGNDHAARRVTQEAVLRLLGRAA
jgi:hypothetical protein